MAGSSTIVSENLRTILTYENSASRKGQWLQQEIYRVTQLTASVGIACNKILAKIASDLHKPNGIKIVQPQDQATFMASLSVTKIPGVGPITRIKN